MEISTDNVGGELFKNSKTNYSAKLQSKTKL